MEAATRVWALDAPIEQGLAKFSQRAASYCLEIWFRASLPKPLPRQQDPPRYWLIKLYIYSINCWKFNVINDNDYSPAIEIDFSELGVNITLPGKNSWRDVIVRGIWFFEDRLSDGCASFPDPKPLETPYGVGKGYFVL